MDSTQRKAELFEMVESGRLSSPRLHELWRDLNVAVADKTAAEQRAVDRGASLTDDPDYMRADTRHSAFFEALIAEAELVLIEEDQDPIAESASSDHDGLETPQAKTVRFLLTQSAKLARETQGQGPGNVSIKPLKDGSVLLRYTTFLYGGAPVHCANEIDHAGRCRFIYSTQEKREWKQEGRRMKRVRLGQYTDIDDWLGPFTDSDIRQMEERE